MKKSTIFAYTLTIGVGLFSNYTFANEALPVSQTEQKELTAPVSPLQSYRIGPDFGYVLGSDTTRVRKQGTVGASFLFPAASNGVDYGMLYQYGWNQNTNYALLGFTMNYFFWDKIPGAYVGGDVGVTDSSAPHVFSFLGEYFLSFKFGYEMKTSDHSTAGLEFKKTFRDTNPIVPIRDTDVYFNALMAYVRWTAF